MNEIATQFFREDRSLFGILHRPSGAASSVFVFCHPFGEEKLWSHRVLVSFARCLAQRGYAVLRFDYMGNGDSEGEFSESSLETAKADVRAAIAHGRQLAGVDQVSLLGLRLGANIASLVAECEAGIGKLVLWAPILDGAQYMYELLRVNLTTQMATHKEIRQDREMLVRAISEGQTVNIDGYELALPMFSQVRALKACTETRQFDGDCLVVQIEKRPGKPSPAIEAVAAGYRRGTATVVAEEPFWKEIPRFYRTAPQLFEATCAWL